mgnify:CR=1 FL=1
MVKNESAQRVVKRALIAWCLIGLSVVMIIPNNNEIILRTFLVFLLSLIGLSMLHEW